MISSGRAFGDSTDIGLVVTRILAVVHKYVFNSSSAYALNIYHVYVA